MDARATARAKEAAWLGHQGVCRTCAGDGLCDDGRRLLDASWHAEEAERVAKPPAADQDDEDEDADEDIHDECGRHVGTHRAMEARRSTSMGLVSVEVNVFTRDGATEADRAEIHRETVAAIVAAARAAGVVFEVRPGPGPKGPA